MPTRPISRSFHRSIQRPLVRDQIDPDAAAYFAAVEGAGGSFDLTGVDPTYSEGYTKTVWNTSIKAAKGSNATLNPASLDIWSKMVEWNAHSGVTQAGSLQQIKTPGGSLTDLGVASFNPAGSSAGTGGTLDAAATGADIGTDCFIWVYITDPHTFGSGRVILRPGTVGYPVIFAQTAGDIRGGYATPGTQPTFANATGLMVVNTLNIWSNGAKGGALTGTLTPSSDPFKILQNSNARVAMSGCGSPKLSDAEMAVFTSVMNYVATSFGYNKF